MSTPGDWTLGCWRARGMKGEIVRGRSRRSVAPRRFLSALASGRRLANQFQQAAAGQPKAKEGSGVGVREETR